MAPRPHLLGLRLSKQTHISLNCLLQKEGNVDVSTGLSVAAYSPAQAAWPCVSR